jgi:hypothetical protein
MNETAIGAAAAGAAVSAGPSGQKKARVRRARRAASVVAVCVLATGGALALSAPAYALAGVPYPPLVNAVSGQCLQDDGNGNGDGYVATASCDGSTSQQWVVTVYGSDGQGNTITSFQDAATGECLENDSYGGGYGNLFTAPCTGSNAQQWDNIQDGDYYFYYNEQSGLCLESDQVGYAYGQVCNPADWQYWES